MSENENKNLNQQAQNNQIIIIQSSQPQPQSQLQSQPLLDLFPQPIPEAQPQSHSSSLSESQYKNLKEFVMKEISQRADRAAGEKGSCSSFQEGEKREGKEQQEQEEEENQIRSEDRKMEIKNERRAVKAEDFVDDEEEEYSLFEPSQKKNQVNNGLKYEQDSNSVSSNNQPKKNKISLRSNNAYESHQQKLNPKKEPSLFSLSKPSFSFLNKIDQTDQIPGRNTDGKHYEEQFRRDFAKMLLEKIQGQDEDTVHRIISHQSQKIKVFTSQTRIWIEIYRIVFAIEDEIISFQSLNNRPLTQKQLIAQIESHLVGYLNRNPREKKYKFIKICNRTFRAFHIRRSTGDYWLNRLFEKYKEQISGNLHTTYLLKKSKKKEQFDEMTQTVRAPKQNYLPFGQDLLSQARLNGQQSYISLNYKNNPNGSQENLYFSPDFREKLIRKIDKEIEMFVSTIFQAKIDDYCVTGEQLLGWYRDCGRFKLFCPDGQPVQDKRVPCPVIRVPPPPTIISPKKRAEQQILAYIRANPSSPRQKIFNIAIEIVKQLKIRELKSQAALASWFNNLIGQHCTVYNNFVHLRGNGNIGVRQERQEIPKREVSKYELKEEIERNQFREQVVRAMNENGGNRVFGRKEERQGKRNLS